MHACKRACAHAHTQPRSQGACSLHGPARVIPCVVKGGLPLVVHGACAQVCAHMHACVPTHGLRAGLNALLKPARARAQAEAERAAGLKNNPFGSAKPREQTLAQRMGKTEVRGRFLLSRALPYH